MTPPDPPPEEFYDELAGDYHLIFADWDAAIAWEAGIITGLMRDRGVPVGEDQVVVGGQVVVEPGGCRPGRHGRGWRRWCPGGCGGGGRRGGAVSTRAGS